MPQNACSSVVSEPPTLCTHARISSSLRPRRTCSVSLACTMTLTCSHVRVLGRLIHACQPAGRTGVPWLQPHRACGNRTSDDLRPHPWYQGRRPKRVLAAALERNRQTLCFFVHDPDFQRVGGDRPATQPALAYLARKRSPRGSTRTGRGG